jgi:hypothetical protein
MLVCSAVAQQVVPSPATDVTAKRYELRIPMVAAGKAGLHAFLFIPSTLGKHPLVLMTHGTQYLRGGNHDFGPGALQPEALWFVRRGWAVAIVIRRGYGDSGG